MHFKLKDSMHPPKEEKKKKKSEKKVLCERKKCLKSTLRTQTHTHTYTQRKL